VTIVYIRFLSFSFAVQGLAWNEQCECWIPAVFEFSKLFKCDDQVGVGMRRRLPALLPVTDSANISISISSPLPGSTLQGDSVAVRCAVAAVAAHVSADGITVDFALDDHAVARGMALSTNDFTYVFKDLKPGPHVVEARAVLHGSIVARQNLSFSMEPPASIGPESSLLSHALPQPGAGGVGGNARGSAGADDDALYYAVPDADEVSVALCIVGEARGSTFEELDGRLPVSDGVAGLHGRGRDLCLQCIWPCWQQHRHHRHHHSITALYQVLDDIYSKIVEPLRADVYVVSSDERWVRCPLYLPYPQYFRRFCVFPPII